MFSISRCLTRYRLGAIAGVLLFILYCQVYYWLSIPDLLGFAVRWEPDNYLLVDSVVEGAVSHGLLQIGDQIISIDGRSMEQGRPIFSPPIQTSYDLLLNRGGQEMVIHLVPATQTPIIFSITTLIALVGWLTGTVVIMFRRHEDLQAIFIGYFSLLSSAILLGIEAFTNGVPGAWVIGHVGVFYLLPLFIGMGLVPRRDPLSQQTKRLLLLILLLCSSLALAALYEKSVFFPAGTSWEIETDWGSNSIAYASGGIGLLLWLFTLLVRTWQTSGSNLQREMKMLLFFVVCGILPLVIGVIAPYIILGEPLLSITLALATLLFIPTGYFFTVYRRGYLVIDLWISRILALTLFGALLFALYMGILYSFGVADDLTYRLDYRYQSVLVVLTLLVLLYVRRPIEGFIDYIVNGEIFLKEEVIQQYANRLVSSLDFQTLEAVIEEVAQGLNVEQALLRWHNPNFDHDLYVVCNVDVDVNRDRIEQVGLQKSCLRSTNHSIFDVHVWAELAVPIPTSSDEDGFILLSAPNHNGFFNAREVVALERLMDVVALSTQAVLYSDSAERRSTELLAAQQQERHKLASAIHHGPEFTIKMLLSELESMTEGTLERKKVTELVSKLAVTRQELASVYRRLGNPFLNQGIELAIRKVVENFRQRHTVPLVTLDLCDDVDECDLSEHGMNALWWIVAESLNNATTHGRATEVQVRVRSESANVNVSVIDNGCGIPNPDQKLRSLRMQQEHYGIMSMVSWVKLAQGRFWLEHNQLGGTTVSCRLPIVDMVT